MLFLLLDQHCSTVMVRKMTRTNQYIESKFKFSVKSNTYISLVLLNVLAIPIIISAKIKNL